MLDELFDLDATALAEHVRRRDVSSLELVEAAIARIEALNERLGAVVTPLFERAREDARAAVRCAGPFAGVPFLLKDLGCLRAGDPISMGTRRLRESGFRATRDSYLSERFAAAGLIPLGRTNTPEFGLTLTTESAAHGPALNPWNPDHSTGGSSGGSAAAVAARLVPMAHANDGGGSIRIPASACGLVGLKPTRGRVSLGPDYGDMWHGLVVEGVVSRSVRDTATILDVISGPRAGDPYFAPPPTLPFREQPGRDPGHLRIGMMVERTLGEEPVAADCVEAVQRGAKLLESLGHAVEPGAPAALGELESVVHFETLASAHSAHLVDEIAAWLGGEAPEASDFEAYTWHLVERGRAVTGPGYIASYEWLHGWSRRIAAWWEGGFDLLLLPTLAAPPPRLGWLADSAGAPLEILARVLQLGPFTAAFNVSGQPAVSLPLHWNSAGLPIGVQLVAPYGREDLLLRVAHQLEEVAPWSGRKPPLCAG